MELRDLKGIVTSVPEVGKETTLRQLLDIMARSHADMLPVVERGTLVGVVSEQDLLRLVRAQPVAGMSAVLIRDMPKHIEGRYVSEIMSHGPMTTSPGEAVEDIIKRMAASGVKAAVVVEGGKVLGIVRLHDILRKYYSFR